MCIIRKKTTKKQTQPKSEPHKCMCKRCGWRDTADKLVFDFKGIIKEQWGNESKDKDDEEKGRINNVIEACSPSKKENALDEAIKHGLGGFPFMFAVSIDDSSRLCIEAEPVSSDKKPKIETERDDGTQIYATVTFPNSYLIERIKAFGEKHSFFLQVLENGKTYVEAIKKFTEDYSKFEDQSVTIKVVFHTGIPDGCKNRIVTRITSYGEENITEFSRCCPDCGRPITEDAGLHEEITLTVIGNSHASKTTAVAAAFYALSNMYDNIVPCPQIEGGDEEWDNFKKTYIDVYEKAQRLKSTKPSEELIPKFSVYVAHSERHYILSFIDLPGELFLRDKDNTDKDPTSDLDTRYKQIFSNVDYIWCCIDAALIREHLLKAKIISDDETFNSIPINAGYGENASIPLLGDVQRRFEKLKDYLPQDNKKCALLILSKIDLIKDMADKLKISNYNPYDLDPERLDYPYLNSSGNFKKGKFRSTSLSTKRFLERINLKNFIQVFERLFRYTAFVTTSNYGCTPVKDVANNLKPYQTEVPLLWLFACSGVIKTEIENGTAPVSAKCDKRTVLSKINTPK